MEGKVNEPGNRVAQYPPDANYVWTYLAWLCH